MDEMPKPEWVKLIPANTIPVFCLANEITDWELERIGTELRAFFGDRKILVIRGDVDIYAIADVPRQEAAPKCICGGEPHVSHCPANPDPFLRVAI